MKIYASSEISFIDESEDEHLDYGTEKQTLLEPNNVKNEEKVRVYIDSLSQNVVWRT